MSWLSYINWVDAPISVITPDVEAGELVGNNLKSRYIYTVWRTTDLTVGSTDTGFTVDFGTSREVGCLALLFPRVNYPNSFDVVPAFDTEDKVKHKLDLTTPNTGALLNTGWIDSGVIQGFGYHVYKLSSPVTARYWRCDLDAISRSTATFVDVSRAWAGPVLEPRVSFMYGAVTTWQADSPVVRPARGLSDIIDYRDSVRTYNLRFQGLLDSERDDFEDFEARVTTAGQFLFHRNDMSLARGTMLARQQKSTGLEAISFNRGGKTMQLIESI